MQVITITGASEISYEVLKDYHSTALAIYDLRIKQKQPLSIEYVFDIDVQANDVDEAKDMFLSYAHKLNKLGVATHIGYLVFLTQAIRDNEGSYISTTAPLNNKILPDLESLQRLLKIQEGGDFRHMYIEFTSSIEGNKVFDNYTRIQDPNIYKQILSTTITTLFESIKSNSHLYSFDVATTLAEIEGLPTLNDLESLIAKASSVNANRFNAQLLYTISLTLLNYLNEWSPLNPAKVLMTNDELRVIYQTLKIHNLLNVSHDLERDALNYIRMLITNRIGAAPMLGITNEVIF